MRLDLGGGASPVEGFVNLDPVHGAGCWKRHAQETPWPCDDGTVSEIHASHVMEHIRAEDRIAVLNEAHRVLAPLGTFEIIVPLFPSWQAMADPTHVSYWVEQSFAYFDGRLVAQADYRIRYWETISYEERGGWEGQWIGRPR